ncbi:unnamed protein product [Natator depressus]
MLQLATTSNGMSAILSQDHGTDLRPVSYASKVLNGVEQGFTPCEKEVLALVWALQDWEYLVGLSPVLVKTSHSPAKYVLAGKNNDGHVSNPRLAKWTLALLNKKNIVTNGKKVPSLSPVPCGLIIEGEQHDCPLPEIPPEGPIFQGGVILSEIMDRVDVIWLVDGSSFYKKGKVYMGYAAVRISNEKVFKGQCLPHLAHTAEIVVVPVALENMPTDITNYFHRF